MEPFSFLLCHYNGQSNGECGAIVNGCISSQLFYPFLFITLTLNIFVHSFAWIDQEIYKIKESHPLYISIIKWSIILCDTLAYNNKIGEIYLFFQESFFLEKKISVASQLYRSSSLIYILCSTIQVIQPSYALLIKLLIWQFLQKRLIV